MNKEVLTACGETAIVEASKLMAEKDQFYVILIKAGSPVGIVTY